MLRKYVVGKLTLEDVVRMVWGLYILEVALAKPSHGDSEGCCESQCAL